MSDTGTDPAVTLYAAGRVALGTIITAAPALMRPWRGDVARGADAKSAIRLFGVRDALMGVALLAAHDAPEVRRRMVLLCAIADSADTLTAAADFARTRRFGAAMTTAAAAGGALMGAYVLRKGL
jgi:hypothetical protein